MGGVINPIGTTAPPGRSDGSDSTLAFGVASELDVRGVADGSISREVRNELDSRSCMVLVMVRNLSSSAFCSVLGVPLRSRT